MTTRTVTLTISIEEPLHRIADAEVAEECYYHVLAQTTVKPDLQAALLPLWLMVFFDPRPSIRMAMAPLEHVPWSWPAFDEARRWFKERGVWPTDWEGLTDDLGDLRRSVRREQAILLDGTIRSTIHSRQRQLQFYEAHGQSSARDDWRDLRPAARSSCSVAQAYIEARSGDLRADDWKTWPPYFPGDSSSVWTRHALARASETRDRA